MATLISRNSQITHGAIDAIEAKMAALEDVMHVRISVSHCHPFLTGIRRFVRECGHLSDGPLA